MEWTPNGQRRIKVEGFSYSQIHMAVAVLQMKTGEIGMAVDGVEPTIEHLVNIRQILDQVVKQIDLQLPQMVQQGVNELTR